MTDLTEYFEASVRLAAALGLGGLVGLERHFHGRFAGLRTHMSVSIGSAIFAQIGTALAPLPSAEGTRVVQGIAAGVGFLGAGTILKLGDRVEVKGLTTAGSIWMASALGTAAGLGLYELAVTSTVLSLAVLWLLRPVERMLGGKRKKPRKRQPGDKDAPPAELKAD
jgi:putative Mg2+ transporter-C (MgtC) family protein